MIQLQDAVASSHSLAQVLIKIGLRPRGANYQQIAKYIQEYRLNTEHLLGRSWKRGKSFPGNFKIPLEEILVRNSDC